MQSQSRSGTPWSSAEERALVALIEAREPPVAIAEKLGRSVPAVNGKIRNLKSRARGQVAPFAVLRENVFGPQRPAERATPS